MVKYIMLFKVEGSLKYLSHLELMKLFRQAFQRAQLPVVFSEGFNPHMKLSFALAKGVGLESEGELLELEVENPLDKRLMRKAINDNLPVGIKVLEVEEKVETTKSLTALLKKAQYEVVFDCQNTGCEGLIEGIKAFLSQSAILLNLKTKKGIREKDVREDILGYKLKEKKGVVDLKILTTSGSERTLRIEPLIKEMSEKVDFKGEYVIKRLALYGEDKVLIHCI